MGATAGVARATMRRGCKGAVTFFSVDGLGLRDDGKSLEQDCGDCAEMNDDEVRPRPDVDGTTLRGAA